MSEFRVAADTLSTASARVGGISDRVEALHRQAGHHAEAAHGTAAAQGLGDLATHWAAVLPHFTAASTGLSHHLAAAAEVYRTADANVAHAAATAGGVG